MNKKKKNSRKDPWDMTFDDRGSPKPNKPMQSSWDTIGQDNRLSEKLKNQFLWLVSDSLDKDRLDKDMEKIQKYSAMLKTIKDVK